ECLRILLPLLAAVFRGERNATVAGSNAQMARSAAAQAQLLAASVDQARSALRQALIGAEAASRAKDEFLASLSHELRTPLTPVLIATAALLEDEKLPEEFHGALEMMQRNIELEVRLIDDLLDLTRIVNGKLTLQKKDCDLHALLDHSLEIVRPEIIAKKLAVEVRKNAQNAWVWADAVRMHQVLWNLLRNAAKFTPEGGRIILESANEGDHVSVSVSDTGMGISPESLEQIFRPFEQGKATGDHRFGGMGLGLAISKAVVDQHSGLLRASSAGAGLGACFTIQLQTVTPPDPTTERR
ncbi:MAG TPA: HAMP domain-containing sensor histidine kinase, partial [Methylomirabilota bacterium]|nr:HAMP domain-containing sensor histidine kinase [Methylomirabilota bacterium]